MQQSYFKTKFRYAAMLLVAMFALVQSAWAEKKQLTASIEKPSGAISMIGDNGVYTLLFKPAYSDFDVSEYSVKVTYVEENETKTLGRINDNNESNFSLSYSLNGTAYTGTQLYATKDGGTVTENPSYGTENYGCGGFTGSHLYANTLEQEMTLVITVTPTDTENYESTSLTLNVKVEKGTYSASFSNTAFTLYTGSTSSFTAPTLTVSDNGTAVTSGYNVSYTLTGDNVTDNTDATTGISLASNGTVTLGDNPQPGTVTVTATITPDDNNASKYNGSTASYTITISRPMATVVVKQDGKDFVDNTAYDAKVGGTFVAPTVTTINGNAISETAVTDTFDIKYYIKDVAATSETPAEDGVTGSTVSSNGSVKLGGNAGSFTVKIVVSPKEAYKEKYGTATYSYTVNVSKTTKKAYLVSGSEKAATFDYTVDLAKKDFTAPSIAVYSVTDNADGTKDTTDVLKADTDYSVAYYINNVKATSEKAAEDITTGSKITDKGVLTLGSKTGKFTVNAKVTSKTDGETIENAELSYTVTLQSHSYGIALVQNDKTVEKSEEGGYVFKADTVDFKQPTIVIYKLTDNGSEQEDSTTLTVTSTKYEMTGVEAVDDKYTDTTTGSTLTSDGTFAIGNKAVGSFNVKVKATADNNEYTDSVEYKVNVGTISYLAKLDKGSTQPVDEKDTLTYKLVPGDTFAGPVVKVSKAVVFGGNDNDTTVVDASQYKLNYAIAATDTTGSRIDSTGVVTAGSAKTGTFVVNITVSDISGFKVAGSPLSYKVSVIKPATETVTVVAPDSTAESKDIVYKVASTTDKVTTFDVTAYSGSNKSFTPSLDYDKDKYAAPTYSISEGVDSLNGALSVDKTTGSTVNKTSGELTIGDKAGKFAVNVTMTPKTAAAKSATSTGNGASVLTYNVNVSQVTYTASLVEGDSITKPNNGEWSYVVATNDSTFVGPTSVKVTEVTDDGTNKTTNPIDSTDYSVTFAKDTVSTGKRSTVTKEGAVTIGSVAETFKVNATVKLKGSSYEGKSVSNTPSYAVEVVVPITPNLTLSEVSPYTVHTSYKVLPGGRFIVPNLRIEKDATDDNKKTYKQDLSNLYDVYYYVCLTDKKGNDSIPAVKQDADGKDITEDPVTGTTIQRVYGGIVVGKGAGDKKKVTIKIQAVPKDVVRYTELTDTFSFNVIPYTPTVVKASPEKMTIVVSRNNAAQTVATSQELALPTPVVLYISGKDTTDVSSHYKIKWKAAPTNYKYNKAGNKIMAVTTNADGKEQDIDQYQVLGQNEAKLKGTLTLKNKEDDPDSISYKVGSDSIVTVTLTTEKLDKDSYIGATLKFDTSKKPFTGVFQDTVKTGGHVPDKKAYPAVEVYRYSVKYTNRYDDDDLKTPEPILTDANGNPFDEDYVLDYQVDKNHDVADLDSCNHEFYVTKAMQSGHDDLSIWNGTLNGTVYNEYPSTQTVSDANGQTPVSAAMFRTFHSGFEKVIVRAFQYGTKKYKTQNVSFTGSDNDKHDYLCDSKGEVLADTFYIVTKKRVPQLVLTPDPKNITISTNTVWSPEKRFDISGYFYDKYTGEQDSLFYTPNQISTGFWYSFDFKKESGIKVTHWPDQLLNRVLLIFGDGSYKSAQEIRDNDKSGVNGGTKYIDDKTSNTNNKGSYAYDKLIEDVYNNTIKNNNDTVVGFRYLAARDFGNDDYTVTFTKSGKVKFSYVIHPWTHGQWDMGRQDYEIDVQPVTDVILSVPSATISACDATTFLPDTTNFKVVTADGNVPTITSGSKSIDLNSIYTYSYSMGSMPTTSDGQQDHLFTSTPGTSYADSLYIIRNGWWQQVCTVSKHTGRVVFTSVPTAAEGMKYVDVTVTATPKAEYKNEYKGATATFSVYLTYCDEASKDKKLWEIIDDTSNNGDAHTTKVDVENVIDADYNYADPDKQQEGKLHFINPGTISPGTEIKGMPGINVTIGVYSRAKVDVWKIETFDCSSARKNKLQDYTYDVTNKKWDNGNSKESNSSLSFLYSDPVVLDGVIPTSGDFLTLRPSVNGFLYADVMGSANEKYMLVYRGEDGKLVTYNTITTPDDKAQVIMFPFPMQAGFTYYLYKSGGDGVMKLHGLAYLPAFVTQLTDTKPAKEATTFLAGAGESYTTESLPQLVRNSNSKVTFIVKNGTKDGSTCVTLNGIGLPNITDVPDGTTRITGIVQSSDSAGIHKAPWYNLNVSDIPTYITPDRYRPAVNERMTTTNHRTAIEATWGGWDYSGPYDKGVDSWKVAKMDSVGRDGRTLDGFAYGSQGAQNAYDEDGKSYSNSKGTYSVPVKGTYIRFEPHEPGRLMVYLMQSGICDNSVKSAWKSSNNRISYRPVYIIDESGKKVDLASASVVSKESDRTLSFKDENYSAHKSECLLRSLYTIKGDSSYIVDRGGTEHPVDWRSGSDKKMVYDVDDKGVQISSKDEVTLKKCLDSYWPGLKCDGDANAAVIKPIETVDGGYLILTKAYMRYSFDVQPGKTYFVFGTGTKIFLDGFAFVPDGWTSVGATTHDGNVDDRSLTYTVKKGYKKAKTDKQATLLYGKEPTVTYTLENKDNSSQAKAKSSVVNDVSNSQAEKPTYNSTDSVFDYTPNVDVKISRKFIKGSWTSLCVPFSVGESQFKQVFGENALIIGFDSLSTSGDVYFTQHVYHMIEAGRPYFIKPDKDLTVAEFRNVTIDSVKPKQLLGKYWDFVGTYAPVTIHKDDAVLQGKKLIVFEGDNTVNSYRAYLRRHDDKVSTQEVIRKAKGFGFVDKIGQMSWTDEENETTGIEFPMANTVTNSDEMIAQGVYDISGRKVADGSDVGSMNLPKGIYIVNGKKLVIK